MRLAASRRKFKLAIYRKGLARRLTDKALFREVSCYCLITEMMG